MFENSKNEEKHTTYFTKSTI